MAMMTMFASEARMSCEQLHFAEKEESDSSTDSADDTEDSGAGMSNAAWYHSTPRAHDFECLVAVACAAGNSSEDGILPRGASSPPLLEVEQLYNVDGEALRMLLSSAEIEALVSQRRFEMLTSDKQAQLLELLPEVDIGEKRLSETALTNKYVSNACKEVQQLINGKMLPAREQLPRKAKSRRQRFFRTRRESESSKVSTASDEGFSEGASFSSESGSSAPVSDQFNPLQFLARAAAEAREALPASQEAPVKTAGRKRAVDGTTVSSASAPVKRKRVAGRKPTRAELNAASGVSARTEGLMKCEQSGTPARLTGSSLLSKVPPNAKVGHLRSRYSAVPLMPLPEAAAPESIEGDSYSIMSSGFDHDYASLTPRPTSFSFIPLASHGLPSEHDYSRSPSLCSPRAGRPSSGKRRSLGDLSVLPSMSLSPLMHLKDPLAITLPSPMEPLTIEDANLVNQLSSRSSLDMTTASRSHQQDGPALANLMANSCNNALSLLAATANIVVGQEAPSPRSSSSPSQGSSNSA